MFVSVDKHRHLTCTGKILDRMPQKLNADRAKSRLLKYTGDSVKITHFEKNMSNVEHCPGSVVATQKDEETLFAPALETETENKLSRCIKIIIFVVCFPCLDSSRVVHQKSSEVRTSSTDRRTQRNTHISPKKEK